MRHWSQQHKASLTRPAADSVFLKRSFLCLTGGVLRTSKMHCRKANFTQWVSQSDADKRRHVKRLKKEMIPVVVGSEPSVPRVTKPTSIRLRPCETAEGSWILDFDFDSGFIGERFVFLPSFSGLCFLYCGSTCPVFSASSVRANVLDPQWTSSEARCAVHVWQALQ